jgi:plasmid stabilization system protein ParE
VATLEVSPSASRRLDELVASHSLPADTRERVRGILNDLASFPRMGTALEGGWNGRRAVIGPWNWMLIVYAYDENTDRVSVLTIDDSRRASSARMQG